MVRRQDLNRPEINGVLNNHTDGGNAAPPVAEIGLFQTWEGRDSSPTVSGSELFNRLKSVLLKSNPASTPKAWQATNLSRKAGARYRKQNGRFSL